MDKIWSLIQDEADAVRGYLDAINTIKDEFVSIDPDAYGMAVDLINLIVSDERDHLQALTYLYSVLSKEKPAVDAQEYIKSLYNVYKDRNKIFK